MDDYCESYKEHIKYTVQKEGVLVLNLVEHTLTIRLTFNMQWVFWPALPSSGHQRHTNTNISGYALAATPTWCFQQSVKEHIIFQVNEIRSTARVNQIWYVGDGSIWDPLLASGPYEWKCQEWEDKVSWMHTKAWGRANRMSSSRAGCRNEWNILSLNEWMEDRSGDSIQWRWMTWIVFKAADVCSAICPVSCLLSYSQSHTMCWHGCVPSKESYRPQCVKTEVFKADLWTKYIPADVRALNLLSDWLNKWMNK